MRIYKTFISRVVVYGHGAETWTMTSEENKLRIFERRMLKKTYEPKMIEDRRYVTRSHIMILII